jgi:hypothetical protein
LLICIVIVGPFIVRGRENKPNIGAASCDSELASLVIRYDVGTNINLFAQEEIFLDWAPQFHIGTFRRNVHDFTDSNFIKWSDAIKPGYSLFYGLDYRTNSKTFVLLPTDILPAPPTVIEICGQRERDPAVASYNIFHANSVIKKFE